jgi:uncharacterized protein
MSASRRWWLVYVQSLLVIVITSGSYAITFPPAPIDEKSDNPLVEACRTGDITKAQQLIKNGENVDVMDRRGLFPLMQASCRANIPLLKLLLQKGADVNEESRYTHESAILCCGSEETAFILLTAGADIHRIYGKESIASFLFIKAAAKGWLDLLETLKGNNQISKDVLGRALYASAGTGAVKSLKQLIGWGAPVNYADEREITVLMHAANNRQLAAAKELLSAGANVNIKTNSGFTALSLPVSDCWLLPPERWSARETLPVLQLLVDAGARAEDVTLDRLKGSSRDFNCQQYYEFLSKYPELPAKRH